uniref:Uncharacterized protein n=1 Tax=Rhizophora mucronata TaxID=61149 RepID=A0A2P2J4I9_RHIMU
MQTNSFPDDLFIPFFASSFNASLSYNIPVIFTFSMYDPRGLAICPQLNSVE